MTLCWPATLALAGAASLAGCATVPPPADLVGGRLSVQVAGQPDKAVAGGFELTGDNGRGTLSLTGPLGSTAMQARWSPGEAVLAQAGGEVRYDSLDALAHAALGEAIPMAALLHWLRGRPWPGAASQARADGLAGFEQLGWRINLVRWDERLLEAVRPQPPVITVRARLAPSP